VELYGCLSVRVGHTLPLLFVSSIVEGEDIAKVLAPILQIMPELRGVSAGPDLTLAMEHVEHVKMDAPVTLSSP
jgi:hypothetical protein